ncbi:multidrug transporter [Brevibacterium sp. 50QC2O2]|uniref:DMT family transporter n=1 Tax=Brevibacterium TaxID=1696 RepID=UPI00211C8DAA|nr:multidrug transporter [Brevibacterium sp. 91QC2O2]MCQ9386728.1 multidrug transporter [Brevibacterium sp. 68QC2CO]MCQ9389690.1 multidrug transporter [Brevibacterium sp. 50QC2O2]
MSNLLAVLLAVISAVALAYGAMLQHRGVSDDHGSAQGFGIRALLAMFSRGVWVAGLAVTGLGMVLNVVALAIAPVMVVQPIGAISVVVSVLLGVSTRGLRTTKRIWGGVALCMAGVGSFVAASATVARTQPHYGVEAHILAGLGIGTAALFLLIILVLRRAGQLLYVIAAGLMYACVATNVHLVSFQLLHGGIAEITWFNVVALVVGSAVGGWFVQAAYAQGPPELVIAGLTVIDPIFAVILGSVLLGEAATAPAWVITVMVITGLAACFGVVVLSRYHPDVQARKEESPRIIAGSHGSVDSNGPTGPDPLDQTT